MSLWQQVLHKDVLDILPCDVHLNPRGIAPQSDDMLLKLARSENGLSRAWSASAVQAKTSLEHSFFSSRAANSNLDQLAQQCAAFCSSLSFENHQAENLYVIAALCHQVNIQWSCSRCNVALYALVTNEACDLQLVWNSSVDRDVKVKTCLAVLSQMYSSSVTLCHGVSCSGLSCLWLTDVNIDDGMNLKLYSPCLFHFHAGACC